MNSLSRLYTQSVFLLFILLGTSVTVYSQTIHIEANISDTNSTIGIPDVKVMLVRLRDSLLASHQTTDKSGHFEFSNLPIDTFKLIVEHFNYETREFYFFGSETNYDFTLNNLILSERGKKIDEVTIFAYKDPVYYRGDTLVYIADSFKTRPNAVVEDLLKKLPGITVEKDGSIKSQGKDISRVFVDGDEFFGSDATLATKNLSASSIERVEVYEAALPDAAASDDKVQILDLRLKDNAKKGYFGKASMGTDFMNYYEGQALINRFSKKQKIAAYFLSANTTRSSLSWRDANQFGIKQGGAYAYNSETDSWEANDNFIQTDDGFPLVFRTGLYFTDQVTDKLKIGANYTYSDFRKRTENTTHTQFFLPDTSYSTDAKSTSNMRFMGHEANLSFEYKIDSTQTLEFSPKFTYSKRTDENNYLSDYFNGDNALSRNTTNTSNLSSDATNIKAKLGYTKKFKKDKRELRLINNFVSDFSNSTSNQLYSDYFVETAEIKNGLDQENQGKRSILSNYISAAYVEPLSKKIRMEFTYELFNTTNQQKKETYNKQGGFYDELDSLTSGNFKSIKFQNRLGASFIYDFRKHFFSFDVAGRNVLIDNQNHYLQTSTKQNETAFLPRMRYIFRITKNSKFQFNVNTNSTLPSINLLQPIRDNSNPNSILVGNEQLRPNYSISSNINYNIYSPLSGAYIYIGLYGAYGINQFIQSTKYDSIGRSINTYINGNTLDYTGSYLSGAIPIVKQVLMLEPRVNYSYGNKYNYVNNLKNALIAHNLSTSLGISLYTDVVEFNFSFDYTYGLNKNKINSALNLTNHTYGLSSDISIYLPWEMVLNTDFEYKNYHNLSTDYNAKPFIWNAEIEQNLGKNKQWTIAVQAYDLLNQNVKVSRSATSNYITDKRTAVISRYFMLNLTYKFNSTFKKAKPTENEE